MKRRLKEHQKAELRSTVQQLVGEWDEDEDGMLSSGRLRRKLKEDANIDCSVTAVRDIMRRDLGLRFKKIKQLAPQTNRLKNIICR